MTDNEDFKRIPWRVWDRMQNQIFQVVDDHSYDDRARQELKDEIERLLEKRWSNYSDCDTDQTELD